MALQRINIVRCLRHIKATPKQLVNNVQPRLFPVYPKQLAGVTFGQAVVQKCLTHLGRMLQ